MADWNWECFTGVGEPPHGDLYLLAALGLKSAPLSF